MKRQASRSRRGNDDGMFARRPTQQATRKRGLAMSLPTLGSVQKLQTALHAKAKGEPKFRF